MRRLPSSSFQSLCSQSWNVPHLVFWLVWCHLFIISHNMNMISDIDQFQSLDFQCIREQPYDFRAIRCFKVAISFLNSWCQRWPHLQLINPSNNNSNKMNICNTQAHTKDWDFVISRVKISQNVKGGVPCNWILAHYDMYI